MTTAELIALVTETKQIADDYTAYKERLKAQVEAARLAALNPLQIGKAGRKSLPKQEITK